MILNFQDQKKVRKFEKQKKALKKKIYTQNYFLTFLITILQKTG